MKLMHSFHHKLTRSPADEGGSPAPADAAPADDAPVVDDAAADPAPVADAAPADAPDFGWAGEDFTKDGAFDMDGFRGHYQDLLTEKTLRDEALAGVPEDGKYDFSLAEDFDLGDIKLPEGVDISIDTEDEAFKPIFDEFGAYLKEANVPQAQAQKMIGFLAKHKAAETAQKISAATDSYNKLGPNDAAREARLSRVGRAIETKLPADQAAALKSMMGTVESVRALEALVMGGTGPKAANPSPASASDEGITPMERLKRANAAAV